MGRWDWQFKFVPEDHDYGTKEFLGEKGVFDGEEIIDIILSKRATSLFIARHLYSFFVSDEPQVPAWSVTPPKDPAAVEFLADTLQESGFHMGTTLEALFKSKFFKEQRFSKVKNPTEVVVGTVRLVGEGLLPSPKIMDWTSQIAYMGQDLLNPPSVEGWHNGIEWINSGTLMKRTNFVSEMISQTSLSGVHDIVERVMEIGTDPHDVVEAILDIMGPLKMSKETQDELVAHVSKLGKFNWSTSGLERLVELMQLVVSTREYQFA